MGYSPGKHLLHACDQTDVKRSDKKQLSAVREPIGSATTTWPWIRLVPDNDARPLPALEVPNAPAFEVASRPGQSPVEDLGAPQKVEALWTRSMGHRPAVAIRMAQTNQGGLAAARSCRERR